MFDLVLHFKSEESKKRFKEIYVLLSSANDNDFVDMSIELSEILEHNVIIKDTED